MDIHCLYMKDYYDAKLEGCYYYHMVNGRPLSAKAHKHDFYEIICVLNGSCYHTINSLEYYCQAGSISMVCPGETHCLQNQSEGTIVAALSVRTDEMQKFLDAYHHTDAFMPITINVGERQQLLHHCQHQLLVMNELSLPNLRMLLGKILLYFLEAESMKTTIPDYFSQYLIEMQLQENLAEGVSAFLRISNFSYSHLCRLTKCYLNMTPGEYILSLRLQLAYEMISWGDESYEEICEKIGFSSFSHFCKLIREHYGMTPAMVRKRNKEVTKTL